MALDFPNSPTLGQTYGNYEWSGSAWVAKTVTGDSIASVTHAATSKTTPVDLDELPLVDSAASWVLKKLTWANLKTTVANYIAGITNSFTQPQLITVSSSSAALHVEQTGTGNALEVYDVVSDTSPFVIDANGSVGIGTTPYGDTSLTIRNPITGSTASNSVRILATVSSDVTGVASGFVSNIATAEAAFTLGGLQHFKAIQNTIGAGSSVTNQYGFLAESSLIGATNNYGFVSGIPAGTGRWNFYASGTAQNAFAGNTSFGGVTVPTVAVDVTGDIRASGRIYMGTAAGTDANIKIVSNATGAVVYYGTRSNLTALSDVTNNILGFSSIISTQATTFTLDTIQHFRVDQGTVGDGSSITSQVGYLVSSSLIGATNNYGFQSSIPAGTGRWNFYASGTAQNAFAGNTRFGGVTVPTVAVDVTGDIIASGSIKKGSIEVGYLEVPQNSQSVAYTAVLADSGKHLLHPSADTTARTFTIPANSSVAYPIGTALTFVNQASAGVMTIAITTDTMRLAGPGTTGSRTLAANGIATALKITSTEWIISGTGLT